MDWSALSATDLSELDSNHGLLGDVFQFILSNDIPVQVQDPNHLLSVMQLVVRAKGAELHELEEEAVDLVERHNVVEANVGVSERELVERIAQLEKELRANQLLVQDLRAQVGATPQATTHQLRRLRDEMEDLRLEATKDKRLLSQEKVESQRLVEELSAERLKVRQLERNVTELQVTVDDYHDQLQRSKVKSGGPGDNNYRQMMIEKEVEYSKLLDDFQLMANSFEETKDEMKSVAAQLEAVKEERMILTEENQQIREALSHADGRCGDVEASNQQLACQVEDLQERISEASGAEGEIMALVSRKAKEWEALLSTKHTELERCGERVRDLEGQLKAVQRHSDKASALKMKKRLQDQDKQLASLQRELSEATTTITTLTDQLEGVGEVGVSHNSEVKVQTLERELNTEIERRKIAEVCVGERDRELVSLRKMVTDYQQGITGLSEAVEAIKKKKEELVIRDNDIAALTRELNHLSDGLNQLSEENEALRERLGLDIRQQVDLSPLRLRKRSELDKLNQEYKVLSNELECLKEDNLSLRKQLVQAQVAAVQSDSSKGRVRLNARPGKNQTPNEDTTDGLVSRLQELEAALEREKVARHEVERDRDKIKEQLKLVKMSMAKNKASVQPQAVSQPPTPHPHTPTSLTHLKELKEQLQHAQRSSQQLTRQLSDKQRKIDNLEKEVQAFKVSKKTGYQPIPFPEGLSPTSNEVINSLNEHLLHVLSTLKQREQEVGVAQEALEKFQLKFSVIIHQQGILYQEYSDARRSWEADRDKLLHDNQQLASCREQDQVHIQQLKSLQEVLSTDPDEARRKMADQSRKITLLTVNEKTLTRKLALATEAEKQLRKDNSQLSSDLVRLERAATERIGDLHRCKEASVFQVTSLQSQLSNSVPTTLLDQANREHREMAVKYQRLLQLQTASTASDANTERLQAEVRMLTEQLESVKQELQSEKQKSVLFTAQCSPTSVSPSPHSERLVTLEMKELNERQRADLATTRVKQLQASLLQLEQRNKSLEDKFSELSQRLLQSQTTESELRDQLATTLTEEEKTLLQSEISKLKESRNQLKLENSQLKEVSEIARQQSVAMEMQQTSHEIELASLRHQLLDLQIQSDNKTALGKLHHQLVALQISEAKAVKILEESSHKISLLEASLLRCEIERDSLCDRVCSVRDVGVRRTRQLRATVQALRRQYAGCVPLVEQERYVELVGRVRADKREAERLREAAKKNMEETEDKLAELSLQHSNLQELLGALTDRTSSSVAARLTEWHARLGEMRLREMKTNRENGRLKENVKHLETLLSQSEGSFDRLDRELVTITKEYESARESWELREGELERQLEDSKKEKMSKANVPLKKLHVGPDLPSRSKPHESIVRKLFHADNRSPSPNSDQNNNSSTKDAQLDTVSATAYGYRTNDKSGDNGRAERHDKSRLERALTEAQRVLRERDREVTELRAERRVERGVSNGVELQVLEDRLETSNERVEQLKTEVVEKDRQVTKYQDLLQKAHHELKDSSHTHKRELAAVRKQLHSQADSAVSQLREAALEIANIPPLPPSGLSEEQQDRLRELEEVTTYQDRGVAQLTNQVEALKRELEDSERVHHSQLKKLRKIMEEQIGQHRKEVKELTTTLSDRSARASELEVELEVLEGELSAAQQAAKQAPSRSLKGLVERLRGQLALKEKQQRALSQALLQVRADLVETVQRTMEGVADRERQGINVKLLVEKRTAVLQEQMDNLTQTLTVQLEESKAGEAAKDEEITALSKGMAKVKGQLQRAEAELELKRRGLDQSKSRERKLANEIHELHVQLEQRSPDVEDLQKKIKVLQGRLEKEKCRISEDVSRGNGQRVVGKRVDLSAEAQVEDKLRGGSAEVARWEESKKWQKKVETLRTKLTEKQRELEHAHKAVQSLKDTLTRSERERSILHGKLKAAQKSTAESATAPSTGDEKQKKKLPSAETESLCRRIYELEEEVSHLKRELVRGREGELFETRGRCEQLTKTVEALEEQLGQQHPGSSQLSALRGREDGLRAELLTTQRENMTLRFDYEQAILELPRLKSRMNDQQLYIEALKSSGAGDNVRPITSKQDGGQSAAELERVVSAMRRVIERLQTENTSLKSRAKVNGVKSTTLTALEKDNKKLKSDLEALSSSGGGVCVKLPSATEKIVTENDKLRKEKKKDQDLINKLQLSTVTLKLENSKLQQEYSSVRPSHDHSCEERVEWLQTELEKKTTMLMEVKRSLRETVDRERQIKELATDTELSERFLTVSREKDVLQQQVDQLKKELDAFDPSFFEEIEDLKFNYQECVRRNVQLEEQLTQQYGVTIETAESV